MVRGLGVDHFVEVFDMVPVVQGDLLVILGGELEEPLVNRDIELGVPDGIR